MARGPSGRRSGEGSAELIDLGPVEDFEKTPAAVTLGGRTFFLVRAEGSYRLFSSACPHQGGVVEDAGDHFECPNHGWRFHHETGACLNVPAASLSTVPVVEREGRLLAQTPLEMLLPRRRRGRRGAVPEDLTLRLVAHSCLEIRHDGFTLLTDPWIEGPAFLGSWLHYPAHETRAEDLRPDALWISHEHSDHYHEPTLEKFDRSTPIYLPDFPNRRMVRRLEALGFTRVRAVPFGETVVITEGLKVTAFDPGSFWNDSIVLVEVGGYRILNLNDAGLNRRIAAMVAPVDLVASAFSFGASGYPLTWTHLEEAEKVAIMERSCQGLVRMLQDAVRLYGAQAVLPYAGHFSLWHPSHRDYVRLMRRNTVFDIAEAFEGEETFVADLLPGESWRPATNELERIWEDPGTLYDKARILEEMEAAFDPEKFARHHPPETSLDHARVREYFEGLNRVPEMAFAEDLTVRVEAWGVGWAELDGRFDLEIQDGQLSVRGALAGDPRLLIQVPSGVLGRIIREDLSWDEAHIGYWCRFHRAPDIFHAGFWRLLQSPWYARPPRAAAREPAMGTETVVAQVLERHGDAADRILRRYGLYCFGCEHSADCTIAEGGRIHGVGSEQVRRLVRELNRAFAGRV